MAVLRGAQNERRGAGVAAEGFACRRDLSGRFFLGVRGQGCDGFCVYVIGG